MNFQSNIAVIKNSVESAERKVDAYFSADIETDGPIPGPFSMLSFAIVYAGSFDGEKFIRPTDYDSSFYRELKPISENYDNEALRINGLDRDRLKQIGVSAADAMLDASKWIRKESKNNNPVLVAYPLSFDWSWLYWYFMNFSSEGSPFKHSRCFDIKTAFAVKANMPISTAGMSSLPDWLKSHRRHSHNALDDAIEQAEIFANVFEWNCHNGRTR